MIVLYVKCKKYRQKGYYVEENRGQGIISNKQKWCGCQKRKETEAIRSKERKA